MLLPSLSRLTPTAADTDRILARRRQATRRLFQAIFAGDESGVVESIAAGAELNDVNADGETVLLIAAKRGDERIVRILLDAGADIDARNPLYWAIVQGQVAVALLLLERGANVSVTTAEGDSPLLAATRHNQTDIALALIHAGARLNAVDRFGDTPLRFSIEWGNSAVVRALLRAGADPDLARDDDGQTPLLAAVEGWRWRGGKIIKLLLDAGALPNVADREGVTPLDVARREGQGEIVALLEERAAAAAET